jgi:hypothetical protein
MVNKLSHTRWVLALAASAVSCSDDASNLSDDRQTQVYGTQDGNDFAHPKIARKASATIPGCCTIEAPTAQIEVLQSDSSLATLNASDWRAEIAFGFHESSELPPGARMVSKEKIDGVVLTGYRTVNARQPRNTPDHLWLADVPVRPAAKARGLVPPRLRISGYCTTSEGCSKLTSTINAIRF